MHHTLEIDLAFDLHGLGEYAEGLLGGKVIEFLAID